MHRIITVLASLSELTLVEGVSGMTNRRVFAQLIEGFDSLRLVAEDGISDEILLNTGLFSVIHGLENK